MLSQTASHVARKPAPLLAGKHLQQIIKKKFEQLM